MEYRIIDSKEIDAVKECVEELSAYHNRVSAYYSGMYPCKPSWCTIEHFRRMMEAGASKVYAC